MNVDYKQSGVDIDAGNEAVKRIKDFVKNTHSDRVLSGLGGFGAMYDASLLKEFQNPVLVQSVDGVGTKVEVASMLGRFENIGRDIVAHCCNDISAMGALPITFLDYLAFDKLDSDIVEEIVKGMAAECIENEVSLAGGETAEMPGVYGEGKFDVAGAILGVVERNKIITGGKITAGDVVLGLASSGLHTNGFSLARKVLFEVKGFDVDVLFGDVMEILSRRELLSDNFFASRASGFNALPLQKLSESSSLTTSNFEGRRRSGEEGKTLGDVLLEPHRNYTKVILGLLDAEVEIKGLAHITGGGFIENIPRALPESVGVEILLGSWPVLSIFEIIQKIGNIGEREMFRTFNMGIGMVMIVSQDSVSEVQENLERFGEQVYEIGKVVDGEKTVNFNKTWRQ